MNDKIDMKRRSRNLSEKKRRDQFNNLINELSDLIDPVCNVYDLEDRDVAQKTNRPSDVDAVAHDDTNSSGEFARHERHQVKEFCQSQTSMASDASDIWASDIKTSNDEANCNNATSQRQRRMDKSSVIRCAMEFLKKHSLSDRNNISNNFESSSYSRSSEANPSDQLDTTLWKPTYISDDEFSLQMLEALDAFIVVCEVSTDAKIIYSSDTLTSLLNYTGNCSSVKHDDYVSLFDLIAPLDKPLIETLFSQDHVANQLEDIENIGGLYDASLAQRESSIMPLNNANFGDEYVSLNINFRASLNLNEIKQNRLMSKNGHVAHVHTNTNVVQEDEQKADTGDSELSGAATMTHPDVAIVTDRSQQSILEQQQDLISQGRAEQQERNQHTHEERLRQQEQRDGTYASDEAKQQRECEVEIEPAEAACKVTEYGDNNDKADSNSNSGSSTTSGSSSDGSGSGTDDSQVKSTSESDQPASTGSDDLVMGARPNSVGIDKRAHTKSNQRASNQRERKASKKYIGLHQRRPRKAPSQGNRHLYEMVRLMATFKGLNQEANTVNDREIRLEHYKFDKPPPPRQVSVDATACDRYFICIGRLDIPRMSYDLKIIVPPIRANVNLFYTNQFSSKHTLKWRFLWIDERAPAIIGYLPFEVLGTSGYDYYHWDDLDKLVISHEGLMRDGHASSGPYRFLTKGQQWLWLQTKYCIILNKNESIKACNRLAPLKRGGMFKFILCTHTVIGFDESDSNAWPTAATAEVVQASAIAQRCCDSETGVAASRNVADARKKLKGSHD